AKLPATRPAATSAATPNCDVFTAFLLVLLRSPGGGGGDRLKVSDDRVDLARGILGQAGAIGSRIDRGRQMTNTAGLREHLPAQFLPVVEGVVRLLRESV